MPTFKLRGGAALKYLPDAALRSFPRLYVSFSTLSTKAYASSFILFFNSTILPAFIRNKLYGSE
ncbi:MAG: hypothetical protein K0Q95_2762 [Bacteroidota bacterium]|nr:hypothetical protein [Bacteroidota bacterium]